MKARLFVVHTRTESPTRRSSHRYRRGFPRPLPRMDAPLHCHTPRAFCHCTLLPACRCHRLTSLATPFLMRTPAAMPGSWPLPATFPRDQRTWPPRALVSAASCTHASPVDPVKGTRHPSVQKLPSMMPPARQSPPDRSAACPPATSAILVAREPPSRQPPPSRQWPP